MAAATNGSTPRSSRIFDIPIDLGQPAELLARITGWVGRRATPTRQVMYVNAHVLNQSQENPALRGALEAADLVYCDGYGVRLAAKALRRRDPPPDDRRRLDLGPRRDVRARRPVAVPAGLRARRHARRRPSSCARWLPAARQVVGSHHGYFEPGSPHDDRVDRGHQRPPARHRAGRHGHPQAGAVGPAQRRPDRRRRRCGPSARCSTTSRAASRARRSWLADNGFEWIFRLAVEPQRMWRRYLLGNPVFLSRVLASAQRHGRR